MNHQSRIKFFWGFHSWIDYVAYSSLLNCAEHKGSIFVVAFGRLISWFPTVFTWIWILLPVSAFFSCKFSCWHPSYLSLTLSSLENLCKINHQLLWWLLRKSRDEFKIHLDASSLFINMYGSEFLRCVCYELLSRNFVKFIPSYWGI